MKLQVLFGQRICRYPGQYAIEAVGSIDEFSLEDNPQYLINKKIEMEATKEFDRLAILTLDVPYETVEKMLYPEETPIKVDII